jgi:DNA-binding response OmpR family regulator
MRAGTRIDRSRAMSATFLLVDDDPEVITTFSKWLQLEGCVVRTAADGDQALDRVDGADAIILDAHMPILDGIGFLRRLRARAVHVPVAVVTGDYFLDDNLLNEFSELNAQVLFKPLWVDELVALATTLVRREPAA